MLAMIYIKINWLTKTKQVDISFYKIHSQKTFNLTHFSILGSTMYILLYKEK